MSGGLDMMQDEDVELQGKIQDVIRTTCPKLKEEKVEALATGLIGEGATSLEDLVYAEKDFLLQFVLPIEAKKLLDKFDQISKSSQQPDPSQQQGPGPSQQQGPGPSQQPTPGPSTSTGDGTAQLDSTGRKRNHDQLMLEEARIELKSTKFPPFTLDSPQLIGVRGYLEKKQRLKDDDRRNLVFLLTKTNLRDIANYDKNDARDVADALVTAFPSTFKDTIVNPKNKLGSDSLRYYLTACLDNNTREPAKKAKKMAINPDVPKAHGCVNWEPDMPEGETEEQHREVMREMVETFTGRNQSDWNFKTDINIKLEKTYPTQRKDLNLGVSKTRLKKGQAPPKDLPNPLGVDVIQSRWPFLFHPEGIDVHFRLLTGESFSEKFTSWVDENIKDMTRALQDANDNCKKVMSLLEAALENNTCESPRVLAAFLMMVSYFKDDLKFIIKRVENTVEAEDISTMDLDLPLTPVLVAKGKNIFKVRKFFIVVDNHVVGTATSFMKAYAVLFSTYFVCNIEYPAGLANLLSFTQRCIAGIVGNGSRGSFPFAAINKRVTKLSNKLASFKSLNVNEESEGEDDDLEGDE